MVLSLLKNAYEKYKDYKDVVDVGLGVGKAYLDYKDAKRRNEIEEAAYDDYMAAAEAAGKEAEAAVTLNLTPMTVSNLPTKKADVTSFTKATGVKDGGIMKLKDGTPNPNPGITALRKKAPGVVKRMGFAQGMNEDMVEEKIYTASYEPGSYSEDEVEAYENYKYEMNEQRPGMPIMEIDDFLRFFYSDAKANNMKMASAPSMDDDKNQLAEMLFGKTLDLLSDDELEILNEETERLMQKYMASGGIASFAKGGRARYQDGVGPIEAIDISINDNLLGNPDYQGGTTTSDVINQKKTNSNNIQEMASSFLKDGIMDTEEALSTAMMINNASEQVDFDKNLVLSLIKNGATFEEALSKAMMIAKGANVSQMKTGGRVKRDNGGIMNLGGMEKDYRFTGGFVPIGEYERKDDVPARLSKNEFVFTADAVRAAGGGSIQKGAKRMYDTMKNLEAKPQAKGMMA